MLLKLIAGLVGMLLLLVFVGIPAVKLKEIPLIVVIVIGVVMMGYEFWEQIREKDE